MDNKGWFFKKKKSALVHLQTPQNLKNAGGVEKPEMNCLNSLFFLTSICLSSFERSQISLGLAERGSCDPGSSTRELQCLGCPGLSLAATHNIYRINRVGISRSLASKL